MKAVKGFTLIELVIGIIVFSIALTIVTGALIPNARRSIDPIYQVRAAELAQSLMNEISAKAYDENSTPSLGCSALTCSPIDSVTGLIQSDGEVRVDFDDVDDFICDSCDLGNSLGLTLFGTDDIYQGFSLNINVFYDDNLDGNDDGAVSDKAKMIRITITMPNDETMSFATHKMNY